RLLLAPQLGELAEKLLLALVEPGRRLHVYVDDQVAAPNSAQMWNPLAIQRDHLTGLGAGPDVQGLGSVQRRQLDRRAEGRGRHGQGDRAMQIVSLPLVARG